MYMKLRKNSSFVCIWSFCSPILEASINEMMKKYIVIQPAKMRINTEDTWWKHLLLIRSVCTYFSCWTFILQFSPMKYNTFGRKSKQRIRKTRQMGKFIPENPMHIAHTNAHTHVPHRVGLSFFLAANRTVPYNPFLANLAYGFIFNFHFS